MSTDLHDCIRPIDVAVQTAARSIARQQDGIVMALVRKRLGDPEIQLQDLHGRLEGFDYIGRPGYREFVLDGRPLVRFFPHDLSWESGTVMTVTQKYQAYS